MLSGKIIHASALGLQLHGEVKNLKAIPYKMLPNEVIK
jgi:hypothetical protein